MILWINGAFGVGKTTVGRRLLDHWADAVVFDPELVGFLVRLTVPRDADVDFQTLPLWRESVLEFALSLDRHYRGPIIVPMCVWARDHHDELLGGLSAGGAKVAHVTLMASEEVLSERIAGADEGREWRLSHLTRCLDALGAARFAVHVPTDGRTVDEIARQLADYGAG